MPTYISFLQYTAKGIEAIKESPKRLDAARKAFEEAGATLKEFYLVMGEFDAVIVCEAPNDEVVARVNLMIGAKGSVRTRTCRAFTEKEYRKIVSSLA